MNKEEREYKKRSKVGMKEQSREGERKKEKSTRDRRKQK